MKQLVIIGAGDFGRELYGWIQQCPEFGLEWQMKGFLDDNAHALQGYECDARVIGRPLEYVPQAGDVFICAVGSPKVKARLVEALKQKGALFVNVIHPTVVIGDRVTLGEGIILAPYVVVSSDARVGDFVAVNLHTSIGHDVVIDAWSFIGTGCALNGRVKVGASVFIGGHVIVLPRGVIGQGAVVGAGSVVIGEVAPKTTLVAPRSHRLDFPKSIND